MGGGGGDPEPAAAGAAVGARQRRDRVPATVGGDATLSPMSVSGAQGGLPRSRIADERRSLVAAGLSSLWPGGGQLYLGHRRRGLVMVGALAAVAVAALVMWLQGTVFVVKLLVRPPVLLALVAGNLALLVFRGYAVFDAYRAGRSRRRTIPHRVALWGLAGILLFTAVPHLAAGYYQVLAYDTLVTVFDEPVVASSGVATPQTRAAPAETTTTLSPTTTTTTIPWEGKERLTVLLLGGDAGPGRAGVRTDTMIAVSVNLDDGDVAIFGLPRNLVQVPLPGGSNFPTLLNELYPYGLEHPDMFPGGADTGANAIKGGIRELLGIDIDFYALVDLNSFVEVIDALGGVTMTVPERVYDPIYPHEDGTVEVIDIQPGEHDFDGHMALAYVRSRRTSDDYNRMGRQRCLLVALVEQMDVFALLRAFPRLVQVVKESVATDIPVGALPHLVDLAASVDPDRAVAVGFGPPRWNRTRVGGYPVPDVAAIQEAVQQILALSPAEAIEQLQLESLDTTCG